MRLLRSAKSSILSSLDSDVRSSANVGFVRKVVCIAVAAQLCFDILANPCGDEDCTSTTTPLNLFLVVPFIIKLVIGGILINLWYLLVYIAHDRLADRGDYPRGQNISINSKDKTCATTRRSKQSRTNHRACPR